jgi:probable HAF family extracellular repeat protein
VTEQSHAVFLSCASQDAEAAQRICEAHRAGGIEVWSDQSELRGGDAWGHSIRRQIRSCALFIAMMCTVLPLAAFASPTIYSVFGVPQPKTPVSTSTSQFIASAVNVSGQFAGTDSICSVVDIPLDPHCYPWLLTVPTITDGPNFFNNGCPVINPVGGSAPDINAAGQAVGTCNGLGFIFTSTGESQQLPTGNGPGYALPAAINATGQVTGQGPGSDAFLYSAGVLTDLGTLPGGASSAGLDINDAGVIVGDATTAAGDHHAFVTSGMTLVDLGTLAGGTTQTGYTSKAYGINNAGQIAGISSTANGSHAFLYSNGAMADLGTLGGANSSAHSINNVGEIVGTSDLTNGAATHAFLYTSGRLLDLNSLIVATDASIALTDATYINDGGWIIVNTGSAVAVPVVFAPRSVTFGGQLVGTSSAPETITITTSGQYSFPTSGVATVGPFIYVSNCPASLAPGAACTIAVTFEPTAAGADSGDLFITGLDIPLKGTGLVPTVSLSASASTLTAGDLATLTWTSANATSCMATGGSAGDGWTGSRAVNGTVSVTEVSGGNVTFTITCTAGSQSASASAKITYSDPPSSGGGGLDLASLFVLLGLLGLSVRIRLRCSPI